MQVAGVPQRSAGLLTYEDGSEHFEHSGEQTGLSECENSGAHRSPEGVGHVIGSHSEGQHEGYEKARDDEGQKLLRERFHFRCCVRGRVECWVF